MKKISKVAVITILLISSNLYAASFNCKKAGTFIEHTICGDAKLSQLDEDLSAAYKQARKDGDKNQIRKEQREWIKKERNKCQSITCLKASYTGRISELSSYESEQDIINASVKADEYYENMDENLENVETQPIVDEKAARITYVNRNELNRVLTRPSKYIGKIIKFKDKVDWDYVTEFQMLDTGNKNYKFKQIMTIKMKGANWSRIDQPLLFIPKDIFEAIDNDFYNKTSKNFTDYYMQSNEMELITISGKDFTKMFGSNSTGKYIYPNDTVILITNINIYNRKLGSYQTRMFNY